MSGGQSFERRQDIWMAVSRGLLLLLALFVTVLIIVEIWS